MSKSNKSTDRHAYYEDTHHINSGRNEEELRTRRVGKKYLLHPPAACIPLSKKYSIPSASHPSLPAAASQPSKMF
jgi:hypothetical protein